MQEFIIKYWMEALFGVILATIGTLLTSFRAEQKEEKKRTISVELGVQALLRDRLIERYNQHMKDGFCSVHDRDNIINMYDQYHTLGANGVIDGLMDELLTLPIRSDI